MTSLAEKGAVHPISQDDLKKHVKKVDEHIESINRGTLERPNLFTLLQEVGGDKHVMVKEAQETVDALRNGFSLYYEMHALLDDRVRSIDSDVGADEKRLFTGAYSMFAAGSYIEHTLGLMLGEEQPAQFPRTEDYFIFNLTTDDTLNGVLARYYGIISTNKRNGKIKQGSDLPKASVDFFKFLRESALAKKPVFHSQLVDVINNAEFRVADEFTISGFQASYDQQVTAKAEFATMLPHQVAGNVLAKKEMLRDMDRIALFDVIEKKNPLLDVGGISWSVLYDGLPGTGKSSLFRMGLTRLHQRCEQVSEFWRHKNVGDLKWKQLVVDQGVKDEFYGKTGKNLLAVLNQAKKIDGIYIITTDDIDLLVSPDRDSSSGGSDRDILNILMQFADGVNTVIRGNVQWWAATNDATAMDPALRQRFIARYEVDGPVAWHDYADITYDKLERWIKQGIVKVEPGKGYTPYEMRKGETGYEQADAKESSVLSALKKFVGKGVTMRDIGEICMEMKKKNPRFTGRAVHAVVEAVKKRINDYDIPEVWYEQPDVFFFQPYEKKSGMLKELCRPVSGEVIISEFERYFASEQRYAQDRFERDVEKRIHDYKVDKETARRIQNENKNS